MELHEYVEQDYDLFELTKQTWNGCIFRFDPAKYPVVAGGFAANVDSYKHLLTDLMTISQQSHGCTLTSNGWKGKDNNRLVACSNFRRYRETHPKAGGDLRKSSLTCDRNNSRGSSGQRMGKRTSTFRPTANGSTCPAKFVIGIDVSSFFLICGRGHDMHKSHVAIRFRVTTESKLPT